MSDEQREPRFFIDHGIIHDRTTGKHIRTVLGDGPAFDSEVHETLAALNLLAADAEHLATGIVNFVHERDAQQAPQARAVTKFQARRQFEDWMWHNGQVGQGEAWSPEQIATVAKYVLALAANPQQITEIRRTEYTPGGLAVTVVDSVPQQIASSPSQPAGWKLVPVEPTPEMYAIDARPELKRPDDVATMHIRRAIWKAMLAAAPALVEPKP